MTYLLFPIVTPISAPKLTQVGLSEQTGSNERRHFHPREATNLVVVNLPTA